LQGADLGIIRA